MEELRRAVEEEYMKNGLSERAIELSHKLDELIVKEQRRKLGNERVA